MLLVLRVIQVLQGHKVLLDRLVQMVLSEEKVQLVLLVLKDQPAIPEVQLERLVLQVLLGLQAHKVLLGQMD